MSPGGIVAVGAWGTAVVWVGYWLVHGWREDRRWQRQQERLLAWAPPLRSYGSPDELEYQLRIYQRRTLQDTTWDETMRDILNLPETYR